MKGGSSTKKEERFYSGFAVWARIRVGRDEEFRGPMDTLNPKP